MRPQDCFDWREAGSGIVGTTFHVKDLHPFLDYAFRVRAVNDFGYSEPTLPVFLNRPIGMHIKTLFSIKISLLKFISKWSKYYYF